MDGLGRGDQFYSILNVEFWDALAAQPASQLSWIVLRVVECPWDAPCMDIGTCPSKGHLTPRILRGGLQPQDSKKEPKKESAGLSPAETKDSPKDRWCAVGLVGIPQLQLELLTNIVSRYMHKKMHAHVQHYCFSSMFSLKLINSPTTDSVQLAVTSLLLCALFLRKPVLSGATRHHHLCVWAMGNSHVIAISKGQW